MTGFNSGRIRHAQPNISKTPPAQSNMQDTSTEANKMAMPERGQDGSIILKLR